VWQRGSEDPSVGVLLSLSAFTWGSVNLEAKKAAKGVIDEVALNIRQSKVL